MEKSTVERSLDASIKDGTSFAVMAGLGDMSYVGACALFLGASKSDVALLVTIPVFLGACAQLATPVLIERTGRRKRLFVWGSFVQALSWIPMIAALFVPPPGGYWMLLGGVVLSFASLHLGVPAWTSVMGDLVPSAARGRFFGRRSAMAIFLQLLAMVLAGAGLAVYKQAGHERIGFAVVFGGAFLARLLSVVHLTRMAEPPYAPREEDRFTLLQFLRRLPRSNFAKFVVFVAFMNASAHFAGCLFIPYWRDTLGFTYWEYMAVVSALILIQVISLPLWGRAADRYGNRRVLGVTSVGIVLLPALWLLSKNVAWAVFLQMWSGFVWSGFNQSVANFLLDAVTPGKRARCTAYLNLLLNTGLLVGGLAGAWAIRVVPADLGFVRLPHAFWTVLLISFFLRALTVLLLLPRFREVRPVPEVGMVDMLFHASRETAESALNLVTGLVSREDDGARKEAGRPNGSAGGS